MLTLPVPAQSWSTQDLTLGGLDYQFVYSFNERDERWRLSIYFEEEPVLLGLKLMENEFLLSNYITPTFNHGDIGVLRVKNDGKPVGRDNLGQDKSYELTYLTNQELAEL